MHANVEAILPSIYDKTFQDILQAILIKNNNNEFFILALQLAASNYLSEY